jgi:hypothetical protein
VTGAEDADVAWAVVARTVRPARLVEIWRGSFLTVIV